ncbi:DUF1883 domain-containing protein [Rhodococcus rhodochrous]|uniref:DUF1883 domain-containing protein n=1 Tax=Rhodococcus rhodochrous TaxID=1829 RepID=UPI003557A364|nr:DUF1883 domain-containing protein [Rhodococcus rhodochrous]
MKYREFDLGHQNRGTVVAITLRGNAANVRLLDPSNLRAYKNGKPHRFRGGLIKQSPYRVAIRNVST